MLFGTPYYGGSVALSLVAFRRSRVYAEQTYSVFRSPVRFLAPFLTGCATVESISAGGCDSGLFPATSYALRLYGVVVSGMLRRG